MIFRALFVSFASFALAYLAVAPCVCVWLGAGTHAWCPLCQVFRVILRRISR